MTENFIHCELEGDDKLETANELAAVKTKTVKVVITEVLNAVQVP